MLGEFKILDLINKFNTEKKKLRRELRHTNAVLYRLYSTVTNKSYIGITKTYSIGYLVVNSVMYSGT